MAKAAAVENAGAEGARAGRNVSALSVAWTVCASSVAVALGIRSDAAVLVAFGAVGSVDASGSVALVVHFRHALRHDSYSERHEEIAHRVVLGGLVTVGLFAIVGGTMRAVAGAASDTDALAVGFTVVSLLVALGLAGAKRSIARRSGSAALASDAKVTAVSAAQAFVVLFGAVMTGLGGWAAADGAATAVIGAAAVGMAILTWHQELSS